MYKWFQRFRWIFMMVSFMFFVFGLQIFGRWIQNIELPVFACPANSDQIVRSACFYLSHLNMLFSGKTLIGFVVYFLTLFLFIVIFGRTFCGFICPMGYMQDITYKIREILHIDGISRNEKLVEVLKVTKYLIVMIFLGLTFFGFNFCRICPAVITSPMFSGFNHAITVGYILAILMFVFSFFMRRFWCNICPLGYLVGIFHKISLFKIKKTCQSCTSCGACYEACPMRIKSIYTEKKKMDVTTSECIFCGECVKNCPENNALAISFCNKRFYISSREDFMKLKRERKKKHG